MVNNKNIKILHLDSNHPLLIEQLQQAGFINDSDFSSPKDIIEQKIADYHGIVIRSRFTIDKTFIDKAKNLQFIARVGAGLENIDTAYAKEKDIHLIAAPEGNCNAVGEHALGMLLSLMNKLHTADREVRQGKWIREGNRGYELEGKTVGIIGYGTMGKSFAKKLQGFDVRVVFHDILDGLEDNFATQVSLEELQKTADVISLHVPFTDTTHRMINEEFIAKCSNPFWLINTSRGKNIDTVAVVNAIQNKKILGAALDVLEYEKSSFESLFDNQNIPEAFQYLIEAENVLLTPHIAGWTHESNVKLAQTIVNKILDFYK